MDTIKKGIDDSIRKIRGKIELVKKPHVSVKEWLESNISINSIISSRTGSHHSSSSTTSGPSTCSYTGVHEVLHVNDMPAKPSKFMAMNMQLQDIFEEDNSVRMKEVLEKGLDPNFIDLNGKPLVYRAVEENKYNILDTMLEFGFGCDVNSTCHNEMNGGWTSLHLACHLGDLRAVEILLGVYNDTVQRLENCDVNAVDIDGRTPLHVLAASSSWHCPYNVSHTPTSHSNPAVGSHVACNRGNSFIGNYYSTPRFVDSSEQANPHPSNINHAQNDTASNSPRGRSQIDNSPLLTQSNVGRGSPVSKSRGVNGALHNRQLTDSGVHFEENSPASSQNSIDSCSNTADISTKYGLTLVNNSQKICHQTCQNNSSIASSNVGFDRSHSANLNGDRVVVKSKSSKKGSSEHGQIMRILLRAGVNANRVDEYNGTPLHICALRGNLEGVKILLEHGADYDLVDNMCETALVKAIVHHRAAVVKCLLKSQHSMTEMKRYELSELVFTIIEDLSNNSEERDETEVVEIIKSLIKKRIHINVTDSRRRTPLHIAVLYGCRSVATMLIKQPSCDIDNADEDGFTPLFLAAWNPKKVSQQTEIELLQLLINRGANINHCDVCKVLPVNAALESGQYDSALILIQQGSIVNSNRWFCASVEILRFNSSTLPFVERFVLSMINNYRHTPPLIEVAAILGRYNLVRAIIKAGADKSLISFEVLQRWVSNETRAFVVADLQVYVRTLQELVIGEVLSLKDLSRISIRRSIESQVWAKAPRLPLPDILQEFIMMKDMGM